MSTQTLPQPSIISKIRRRTEAIRQLVAALERINEQLEEHPVLEPSDVVADAESILAGDD